MEQKKNRGPSTWVVERWQVGLSARHLAAIAALRVVYGLPAVAPRARVIQALLDRAADELGIAGEPLDPGRGR